MDVNWARLIKNTKTSKSGLHRSGNTSFDDLNASFKQTQDEYTHKKRQGRSEISNSKKSPILCIDLKILNSQNNVNVFEGDSVIEISQRISIQNGVPEKLWWRVE